MRDDIPLGIALAREWPILEEYTVRTRGSVDLPVLATPHLIFMLEDTCVFAVAPFLGTNELTVGTAVYIDHVAAAEVGNRVSVVAELVSIRKRRLVFRVEGRCGRTIIGRGIHERAVITRPPQAAPA